MIAVVAIILFALFIAAFIFIVRKKKMQSWLWNYTKSQFSSSPKVSGVKHVMFCFVDHYEPQWLNKDNIELERKRVDRWMVDYPKMAQKFTDADGCHPKHSFFYPEEEYRKEHLDKISDLCAKGFGEIEIHLHHENDTSDNLRKTLSGFANTLHNEHNALSLDPSTGKPTYAFIHGNWVLDNSHPKGHWCGVNDELIVLRETGCYADFTFPSPDESQPAMLNTIYYAKDDPVKPKSYETGKPVEKGGRAWGDILLVQGILGLNWKVKKKGIFPQIENSDVRSTFPPTPNRVDLWVEQGIHVKGKPEWIFIKIHTHGAQDNDMNTLLGEPIEAMHRHLNEKYNDGENFVLHYVSAREMYNIIKAAEADLKGDPNNFRNYVLPAPMFKRL
ncbi:hypothetical protein [Alteromonas naphthalenivorans]|uniref:Uncharacterized protein n=1 Tax=Alteromonas naphthalenivorans TaxID=715451 RepID=F5ZAS1_ALTNA|nr:hypothetical protein [Alteromonas naphthalenivorans]AEF02281.1 hypothetical protein ambt_03655 [Alteromonas naphthalenivorans]